MVIKSLIFGIIFTLGIFAVKSGVGLFYAISESKKKLKIFLICFFSYFMIFLLAYFIIVKVNILNYFQFFQSFLKSAMLVHIILAAGMIWWGLNVLLRKERNSKAYLMLVLPCPFCSLSIFIALSFLLNYSGEYSLKWTLILFCAFILIQVLTLVLIKLLKVNDVNDFLGFSLIFIGAYFIITFCTAPVFSDIGRIYRISSYSSQLHFIFAKKYLTAYSIFAALILTGFMFRQFQKRKVNVR